MQISSRYRRPRSPAVVSTSHSKHSTSPTRNVPPQSYFARRRPHNPTNLWLQENTRDTLRSLQHIAEVQGPDEDNSTTHCPALSGEDYTIAIEYQHTLADDRRGLREDIERCSRLSWGDQRAS
ncbi:hypothetical protein BD310DRAFT_511936 [Dichomitus squalens]|uniref:Uncharacterized protein n=1 Tax=Dichomitus squalens TaxID=114155 RepID=A0A4Q9PTY8_9APHY|nr:hypothetical protein BD310DRAFT_511936 [Dichomitus squalens]